jgi:hypothetical protein
MLRAMLQTVEVAPANADQNADLAVEDARIARELPQALVDLTEPFRRVRAVSRVQDDVSVMTTR